MKVGAEPEHETKRKKRTLGVFPCPECTKTFSRLDHLARHYLNHQPKKVYTCGFMVTTVNGAKRPCGKTFVRKDLKERHAKRHLVPHDGDDSGNEQGDYERSETHNSAHNSPLVISNLLDGKPDNGPDAAAPAPPPPAFVLPPMPPPQMPPQISPGALPGQMSPPMPVPGMLPPGAPHLAGQGMPMSMPGYSQVSPIDPMGAPMAPQMAPPVRYAAPIPSQGSLSPYQYAVPPMMLPHRTDKMLGNAMPLQSDILSWLFMDLPLGRLGAASSPTSSHSGGQALPSQTQFYSDSPNQRAPGIPSLARQEFPDDLSALTTFYHNPTDPVLNLGLQELNYFLNNDNPLDEVFLRSNDVLDKSVTPAFALYPSTASSSSPSSTNESITPKTVSEASPQDVEIESTEKKIRIHAQKGNVPPHKHYYVNASVLDRMLAALPSVSREKLEAIFPPNGKFTVEDAISFYLYGYWETFHPRFALLHRPSFNTKTAEPLLLLAMLLIGCMYCASSIEYSEQHRKCPEFKCCMMIAVPLRFTLFQHEDFKSPVKVWILQTLNLIEWCEKNYLVRDMHERAHIHHGTTVQLLRRSPFLGGNPTVTNKAVASASDTGGEEENSDGGASDEEEASNNDQRLFRKWVESESMKRVTFMTFYLDVIDYIKFRHNPQIPFFQLQLLNLPCDEENLWNCNEINGSFRLVVKRQKKLQRPGHGMRNLRDNRIRPGMNFLSALKRIMKPLRSTGSNNKLTTFTKSILFGGIVSIMHQMQQTELQNTFTVLMTSLDKGRNSVWKEILTKVFDTWEEDMSMNAPLSNDPYFTLQKGQCNFPMYHLAQIIGMSDINHYDIAIFGGSPRNMSVDATAKDLSIVQRKLNSIWHRNPNVASVNDLVNIKSVVHCYWLLWGLMLAPLDEEGKPGEGFATYGWRVDHDYYDSMYAVSIATLVLWCYVYSMYGVELENFKELEDVYTLSDQRNYSKISVIAEEDGYSYLFRVREHFVHELKSKGLGEGYLLHCSRTLGSPVALHEIISKHCELLPHIPDKHKVSGLCFLVGTKLLKSQWQVIRENAKLIINCGLRSAGKRAVHCADLFDNEFGE